MAKTSTKIKAANLPVPQTAEAAADAIFRIGEINRTLERQDTDLKDALAKVKRTYEEAAKPFADERTALVEGVRVYCEAHRTELTREGKTKTAQFTTGSVSWRLRPPSVKLPRDVAALIAAIKDRCLPQFLRLTEDVSREAMLAEPDTARGLPGVRISSEGEDFAIEPFTPEGLQAVSA